MQTISPFDKESWTRKADLTNKARENHEVYGQKLPNPSWPW
jgi:hypothetical protein